MRLLVAALLVSLLLAGCTSSGPSSPPAGAKLGDNEGTSFPLRYYLNASLRPPVTHYSVVSRSTSPFPGGAGTGQMDNGSYTWTWSTTNKCGRFEPLGSTALWHHGDDTDCGHDSPSHPGTISVVIGGFDNSTSSTGYGTCEYTSGSDTGVGEACFVSSVAPEGKPRARSTSLPSPAWAAPVALGAVALLLERARRR